MSSTSAPVIYRMDDIEIDATRGSLRRGGRDIHLKPKTFQLLVYLLTQRDRLVSKEELMAAFWKDSAVTDDALTQCVVELRRALGDNSRNPVYLKTVPRRGYRFVAEVREIHPAEITTTEEITTVEIREEYSDAPRQRRPLLWVAAALLVLLMAAAACLWFGRPGPPPAAPGKRQVAILRFENRSGQNDLEWMRDGLPDMLATALLRSKGLDVLSREQVFSWLGRVSETGPAAAVEIARRSHANAAVMGGFEQIGGRIRIDARVYDGGSGALLAAESITADKPDRILTEVDLLGARLAARLAPKAGAQDRRVLASLVTDNLEAYRCYALGLAKADAMHTDEAVELFRKAAALDPNFAMAYARIGYAYALPGSDLAAGRPFLEKAFAMAGKLTEKDRRHIVAWYAIANQDFQEAIRDYSSLVEAYPNETEAYFRLSMLLRGESRHEEGVEALRQALALDPENPPYVNALSALLSEMGKHDEAIEMAERYVGLTGDANAYDSVGLAYQLAGLYGKAVAAFAKALELDPDFEVARAHRAIAWMQMGMESKARHEFLRRAEAVPRERARYWQLAAWLDWRRGRSADAQAALLNFHRLRPGTNSWIPADPAANLAPMPGRGGRWALRWQFFDLAQRARAKNRQEDMLANLREALQHRTAWGMPEPLEDVLADAYLTDGKLDEAIAEYERALKLFPGMARARFHLAQAYRRNGRQSDAAAQLRQFLAIWKSADPDLPEVIEAERAVRRD